MGSMTFSQTGLHQATVVHKVIHIVVSRNNHRPLIHFFREAGGTPLSVSATVPRMDTSPPLLGDADLPGPICLNRLHSLGVVCKLDNDNAYSYHDSRTLYGRASIISTLMPSRSVACAGTAAWVWLGGMFPNTIDIISKAHYRTARYGRKVSVFNRQAPDEHVTDVGPITVTTPTRTACDLAMNCTPETQSPVTEIVCMLMQEFRFRPDDCLQVMQEATHIRNAPRARQFFRTIGGKQ
jgi:hypothetical protein